MMRIGLIFFICLFSLAQSPNIIRYSHVSVDVFGFWRLLLASVILLLFHKWRNPQENLKQFYAQLDAKQIQSLILSGAVFFAHLWTFFFAAKNTQISNAMTIYSIHPLFAALGTTLFFSERITLRLIFSYLLAVLGIIQIFSDGISFTNTGIWGDLSALASALLFAIYALLSKGLRQKISNSLFAPIVYLVTALFFGLTGALQMENFSHHSTQDWLSILASVLLPTLLGHALFTYLMNDLSLNKMTLAKLAEPPLAFLTAYWVFEETLKQEVVFAFLLISASVIVLFLPTRLRTRAESRTLARASESEAQAE